MAIETRIAGLDWDRITHEIDQRGWATTGPVLAVGGNANFTYVLTNIGNVALNNVVVVDDNGTPGNTADDFNPTFSGGDTNSNNLLDLGETLRR